MPKLIGWNAKACLPGSADLSKTINIDNSKPQDAPVNKFFVDQLKNIPIYKSDWEIYSRLYNSKVIIQGLKPSWFDAADYQVFFYPYNDITFNHSADQNFKTNENGFELSVELNNFRIADPAELNGILVITESWEKGKQRKSLELNSIINN
jgi:DsbC/DsbD-like thiol-disulfide interchange protein